MHWLLALVLAYAAGRMHGSWIEHTRPPRYLED